MNVDELLTLLRPYLQQMNDDEVPMAKDAMAIVTRFDDERKNLIQIFGSDRLQETYIILGGVDVSHLVRRVQLDIHARSLNPVLKLELTKKPQIEISDEAAAKIVMYYSDNDKPEDDDGEE